MTESEAIKTIQLDICNGCECIENCITNQCEYFLAINALEKRIPKKPIFTEDKQFALCPCCDMKGLTDKQKYCDNCGQAIDWSDEE